MTPALLMPMRIVAAAVPMSLLGMLVVVLAGCPARLQAAEDNGPADPSGLCVINEECRPAAAKCCDCPTFATRFDDPVASVCDQVECPPGSCADSVDAVCGESGTCELQCRSQTCDSKCEFGFVMEANGCISCSCAPAPGPAGACMTSSDCVETRADCCGCQQGGIDTAVLASEQMAFDAALMCQQGSSCPGVSTCDATLSPECVQGKCQLLPPLPQGACGRTDLADCPTGTTCVINANDQYGLYGVGSCQPTM